MATISKEEMLKRIVSLAQRQGLNRQKGATAGRQRRNIIDTDSLDQRRIGVGLGLQRSEPTREEDTELDSPPERPERATLMNESEYDNLGLGDGGAAPTGPGTGIGVLGPMIGPFAASIALNAIGIPVPPMNPYSLFKVAKKAIGHVSPDNPEALDQDFTDINQDIGFDTIDTDPDVGFDIDAYGETGGAGTGSPGNAGSSNAGHGSPLGGGGQHGDTPGSSMGDDGGGGDGK
ncbi:hypothetical protein KAR91_13590 [Candidatus Pacearchaeota archaeon]|nr:hypothetical protein [Candidatus Pacearchaeota archaeon]